MARNIIPGNTLLKNIFITISPQSQVVECTITSGKDFNSWNWTETGDWLALISEDRGGIAQISKKNLSLLIEKPSRKQFPSCIDLGWPDIPWGK